MGKFLLCAMALATAVTLCAGTEFHDVGVWTDRTNLMQAKMHVSGLPPESHRIAWMYGSLLIDFLWISLKMMAAWSDKSIGTGCEFLFTLLWYPLTIHTLGWAFPGTTITQGIDLATQQLTSIGYGSANVRGNDQKLYHAVNGLASQLGPAGVPGFLLGKYVDWIFATMPKQQKLAEEAADQKWKDPKFDKAKFMEKYCPDMSGDDKKFKTKDDCESATGNFAQYEGDLKNYLTSENEGFWKKLIMGTILLAFGALTYALLQGEGSTVGGFQALYATLISATTIGYGDISPSKDWEKQLSAFVLPFLTASFAEFFGGSFASGSKADFIDDLGKKFKKEYLKEDCGLPIEAMADAFIAKTRLMYNAQPAPAQNINNRAQIYQAPETPEQQNGSPIDINMDGLINDEDKEEK